MSAVRAALRVAFAPPHAGEPGPRGLWGRAFRPFFLGLALHAGLAIPAWTAIWLGLASSPAWLLPMRWHGHEMVFGFVAAAIAGFLLTASPVWTGGAALAGRALAALFVLWVAGRVAFAAAAFLPAWLVAAVDVPFLPAVALVVGRTLWGSGQTRNVAVLGIVAALALANAAMHAEALGFAAGVAGPALRFAVDAIAVLILVIGGRITPAFTQNAFRRDAIERTVRPWPAADTVAIGAAGALALVTLVAGRGIWTGGLAAIAGIGAAARMAGWQTWATRSDPLVWSLHAGLAWISAGLLLVAASDLGAPVPSTAGLHALTAGAMGSMILAVITRVSLGHTGRPLRLPDQVVWGYALVHAGALLRVASAFVSGEAYRILLVAGGLAWAAAFLLFAARYGRILVEPRADGGPG